MTRLLTGALRHMAAIGAICFFSLAVAATVLIFCAFENYALSWDSSGPYWPFGKIAAACYGASLLCLTLWGRLAWSAQRATPEPLPEWGRPTPIPQSA